MSVNEFSEIIKEINDLRERLTRLEAQLTAGMSHATTTTNVATYSHNHRPSNILSGDCSANINFTGDIEKSGSDILAKSDVDDTPVDAATDVPVSSNWAYDHENAADPHTGYALESGTTFTGQVNFANGTTYKIEADGDAYFKIIEVLGNQINHTVASGLSLIDINPIPSDGTSDSSVRLFRLTNTSGDRYFMIKKGDGTDTTTFSINADNGKIAVFGGFGSGVDVNFAGGTTYKVDSSGNATFLALHVNDMLDVDGAGKQFRFLGTAGGGGEGIVYKDSGGTNRYALNFPGSNVVAISNRAANGVVQIRANTSTAGGGGEVTVAQFEDDMVKSEVALALKDGIAAPSATAGYAKIYVDSADGDLKIIFGDGTVKTIVTDT